MKMLTSMALVSVLAMLSASAELKVPRSIFKMDQLEEAKAKAKEGEKPLVFVYTDPGTT